MENTNGCAPVDLYSLTCWGRKSNSAVHQADRPSPRRASEILIVSLHALPVGPHVLGDSTARSTSAVNVPLGVADTDGKSPLGPLGSTQDSGVRVAGSASQTVSLEISTQYPVPRTQYEPGSFFIQNGHLELMCTSLRTWSTYSTSENRRRNEDARQCLLIDRPNATQQPFNTHT